MNGPAGFGPSEPLEIPLGEAWAAATLLTEMEWLQAEIEAGRDDAEAITRQERAASVLFSVLDDVRAVPGLRELLRREDIDSERVLQWYSGGAELAAGWRSRHAYVRLAASRLRPCVERSVRAMDPAERQELDEALQRRRLALTTFSRGEGPQP